MAKPKRGYAGRFLAVIALTVSFTISVIAAWQPDLGIGCVFTLIIAATTEPTKYLCNRTIYLARGVPKWKRFLAFVWYIGCICVSVYLMHDLIARTTAGKEAEIAAVNSRIEGVAADQDTVKGDIAKAKAAVEEAQNEIQPRIRSSDAIRAIIRADHLNKQDLAELHDELTKAEKNDRLNNAVDRLTKIKIPELEKKLLKSTPERSRSSGEVQKFTNVHEVHERFERVNILGIAAAIALEVLISGGFWVDSLYNRGLEAPEPVPVVIAAAVNVQRTMNACMFEDWLAKEWRTKRGKDGWLEGTQHAWANACGISVASVHAQLRALVNAGKIEKTAQPGGAGRTRIRFLAPGALKIVR